MAHDATFRGYGPEKGYPFLREKLADSDFQDRSAAAFDYLKTFDGDFDQAVEFLSALKPLVETGSGSKGLIKESSFAWTASSYSQISGCMAGPCSDPWETFMFPCNDVRMSCTF